MNIRTMYLRTPFSTQLSHKPGPLQGKPVRIGGTPVGCVVTSLAEDQKTISYQVTSHNPLDEYNRKIGRELAVGRLALHPIVVDLEGVAPKRHAILRAVLLDIVENASMFPIRLSKAADHWLTIHKYQEVEAETEAVVGA